VLRGEYEETLAGAREMRGAMTLIYYPADCPHAECHYTPGRHFLVEWDAEWARRFELWRRLPSRPTIIRQAPALFAALRALRAIHLDPAPAELDFESALLGVFDAFRDDGGKGSARAPLWLAQITDRLRAAEGEPLTLTALADGVGVNPANLARTFKRIAGCTIGEMRRRMQVERACRHLASTQDALAHVAVDAGFADQSHMTRAMREATGFTPKGLRQALTG
jgi:AraC family transcriptional regulator